MCILAVCTLFCQVPCKVRSVHFPNVCDLFRLCDAGFKLLCMVVTLLLVARRKNPLANAGAVRDAGSIPGQEGPLEEGITTHSSILAWRIPQTEKLGGLQFVGSP